VTKKSIDIQDEIDKCQAAKPVILKCSYAFHRKLKKQRSSIADPEVSAMLSSLAIKPVGTLPDHIILLCNAKGGVIRMINLSPPKQKSVVIH